jgi:hypothetical protein
MTNVEMLMIRACKTNKPQQRLASVYRRFYLDYEDNFKNNICFLLAEIIDEICPISLCRYFDIKDKKNLQYMLSKETPEHWEKELSVLIHHIRFGFTAEDYIKTGCRVPAIFRNKGKN